MSPTDPNALALPQDPAFRVIETLRAEDGHPLRLARHLDRLHRSCAALGITPDETMLAQALAQIAPEGARRVRLTVDPEGKVEMACPPLPPTPASWRIALAPERLDSADPWLRHKTTRRALYDRARAELPAGLDELIFVNERGELCEGTITNLFLRMDGILLTPPLASGLLPGILREELLETGQAVEAVLHPGDLSRADAIFMGNALRGLIASQPGA